MPDATVGRLVDRSSDPRMAFARHHAIFILEQRLGFQPSAHQAPKTANEIHDALIGLVGTGHITSVGYPIIVNALYSLCDFTGDNGANATSRPAMQMPLLRNEIRS